MKHPEGRILAIQQQMFFAGVLAEQMALDSETILRKLSLAGLKLVADTDEVAVDAAVILPKIPETRGTLRAVPETSK